MISFHFALCQTELIVYDSIELTLQKWRGKKLFLRVVFVTLRVLSKYVCRDSSEFIKS